VLPAERVNNPVNSEPFLTFVPIENKGSGTIESITIDLIYDNGVLDIPDNSKFFWYCSSRTCNVTFQKGGGSGHYTFTSQGGAIKSGETYTIYNHDGKLTDANVIGKSTDLISAVATYRYRQQFDEQIACIQYSVSQGDAICSAHDNSETDCTAASGCKYCAECSGTRTNQWSQDKCVSTKNDCGYRCVYLNCNARCDALSTVACQPAPIEHCNTGTCMCETGP
jgi:hypothetical protein